MKDFRKKSFCGLHDGKWFIGIIGMIGRKKLTTMSSSCAFILAGKTVAGGARRVWVSTDRAERSVFSFTKYITHEDPKI